MDLHGKPSLSPLRSPCHPESHPESVRLCPSQDLGGLSPRLSPSCDKAVTRHEAIESISKAICHFWCFDPTQSGTDMHWHQWHWHLVSLFQSSIPLPTWERKTVCLDLLRLLVKYAQKGWETVWRVLDGGIALGMTLLDRAFMAWVHTKLYNLICTVRHKNVTGHLFYNWKNIANNQVPSPSCMVPPWHRPYYILLSWGGSKSQEQHVRETCGKTPHKC